jgi:hypothetical protein
MVTELFSPAVIIAIGALILGLLFIWVKAADRSGDKTRGAPNDRWISWYSSCYLPCMKNPDASPDSCATKCSWNSL